MTATDAPTSINYNTQMSLWGFCDHDRRPFRKGEVRLDAIWEYDSRASDTLGHPLWDRTKHYLNSIRVTGEPVMPFEIYALPYVAEAIRSGHIQAW